MKTKLFRLATVFIICVLLLSSVLGCAENELPALKKNAEPNTLSTKTLNKLNELYKRQSGGPGFSLNNFRHYGTYDGCAVFFVKGNAQFFETVYIAYDAFHCSTSFMLYAYKDGKFANLKDAFKNGWITKEAIHKAAIYHESLLADDLKGVYIDIERDAAPGALPEETLNEFIRVYSEKKPAYGITTMIHYGTYDGSAVFFIPLEGKAAKFTIREYVFSYHSQFKIIVYRAGRFDPNIEADILSDEHLKAVYEYHLSRLEQ